MNYTCPYCNQPTTITSPNQDTEWQPVNIAAEYLSPKQRVGLRYTALACPNKDCKKLNLAVKLTKSTQNNRWDWTEAENIETWQLLPESAAKPQPNYIPQQLVSDYVEACRIKDLSPKASATLSRRCLQGLIRDFWGIKKDTLKLEIDELEQHVSEEVWGAIDAVRSVGNIGAHFEKDVNIIVEIEPEEANLLLSLIEDLFTDWYVVRHERQERQRRIKELAKEKHAARKNNKEV